MSAMDNAKRAWNWYVQAVDQERILAAFLHHLSWWEYCEEALHNGVTKEQHKQIDS